MKKFILNIVLVSLVVSIISWIVFVKLIPQYYLPVFPFLILFFLMVSVLVHAYQFRLAKKDMAKFTRSNMLITFFKLFIYSVVAFVYIAMDKERAMVFVIYFVLLYVVFSIFEVRSLLKMNSKK